MIGKLKGLIDSLAEDHLILDVQGVGYKVYASPRTLARCETGTAQELIIETHVREDHIHLYGFPSAAERDAFIILTSVQGVGVRMALAILGQFNTDQLYHILASQDKKALTQVSGVGPKLAERILTELKSKAGQFNAGALVTASSSASTSASPTVAIAEDAVSALSHLGYSRSEAYQAVQTAIQTGQNDLDGLIKASLATLQR